jgi:hypothetical protein
MKRIVTLVSLLLGIAILAASTQALVPGAQAASPGPKSVKFTLSGTTTSLPAPIPIPPPQPRFWAIRGLEAAGTVDGYFKNGEFTYTENILANSTMTKAATKGDMTITVGGDTVKVTFFGVDQLDWSECENPQQCTPKVIVKDQPWVFTGGTGQYEGIKGGGVRNSLDCKATEFCVKYTGKIFN